MVIQLLDSVVLTRPSLYLSSLLLCVRGMLHLPYPLGTFIRTTHTNTSPHTDPPLVNVISKIDNLKAVGGADLPFNLDFYTEVQDLTHLLPALAAEQASTPGDAHKWHALNAALVDLVEDFGLVGFETLAVEDRASMAALLRAVDRASGYVFAGARATDEHGRTLHDAASIWAQAMGDQWTGRMEVRDVQERWIERKEEMDEEERRRREEEDGASVQRTPSEQPAPTGKPDVQGSGPAVASVEDEMLAEQRKWEEGNVTADARARSSGVKVVRKG